MNYKKYLPIYIVIIACLGSCSFDKLEVMVDPLVCDTPVTYTNEAKAIIETNCAYTGCHVSGFASGDFTSYTSMEPMLNQAKFGNRVVTLQNMPPEYATGPTMLTDEELNIIKCWIENDYAE